MNKSFILSTIFNKCSLNKDSLSVNEKIRLLKTVRNRIESRLSFYLDS